MYVVGEYVFRANEGICRVSEIGHPDFLNPKEERMYYILIPKGDTKTKIYVPTEPEPIGIRRLISKDEALKLIQNIQYISPINIANEKQREQEYKQALRSNDPFQLAAIIKTLYTREQFRTTQGKKLLLWIRITFNEQKSSCIQNWKWCLASKQFVFQIRLQQP